MTFRQTYAGSVAHSPLHLVQDPASGGCTGYISLAVDSHRSNGAHLSPAAKENRGSTGEGLSRRYFLGGAAAKQISHIWHSTGLAPGARFFLQRMREYSVMRDSSDTSGMPMVRAN